MADSSSQAPPTEQVEKLHLDEETGEMVHGPLFPYSMPAQPRERRGRDRVMGDGPTMLLLTTNTDLQDGTEAAHEAAPEGPVQGEEGTAAGSEAAQRRGGGRREGPGSRPAHVLR